VPGHPAFRPEREHDLWPEAAHLESEVADHTVQLLPIQLAVGIVEYYPAGDLEDPTGGGKLLSPHDRQLVIVFGSSTVGGCLPRRKTNYRSLDAPIMVECQRTAESSSFIIRMCRDAHHAPHETHCTGLLGSSYAQCAYSCAGDLGFKKWFLALLQKGHPALQ